jgi:transcriptional regulator of heat shock response
MINRINKMIELNLQILFQSQKSCINLNDFEDDLGKKFKDAVSFARLLKIKQLVIHCPENRNCFQLTELGKQICDNGGWLKYIDELEKKSKQKTIETNIESKKIKKKRFLFFNV